MSPFNFIYWLQAFMEVSDHIPIEERWKTIQDRLTKCLAAHNLDKPKQPLERTPGPAPYTRGMADQYQAALELLRDRYK